jgi:hypothetical protein
MASKPACGYVFPKRAHRIRSARTGGVRPGARQSATPRAQCASLRQRVRPPGAGGGAGRRHASTPGAVSAGTRGGGRSQGVARRETAGAPQRASAGLAAQGWAARGSGHRAAPVGGAWPTGVNALGGWGTSSTGRCRAEAGRAGRGECSARNRSSHGRTSARSVARHPPDHQGAAPTERAPGDRSAPAPTADAGGGGLCFSALYKAWQHFF